MSKEKNWTDPTSYEPIKPNDHQETRIKAIRAAARAFAEVMDKALPAGPDKVHTFRQFRTAVMWANYTISRGAEEDTKDEAP
jgi:hypothetical protein